MQFLTIQLQAPWFLTGASVAENRYCQVISLDGLIRTSGAAMLATLLN